MNFVKQHKKTFLSILLFVLLQVSFLTFYVPTVRGAFEDSIFFEFGAEGGEIGTEPDGFDWIQTSGGGYIKITGEQDNGGTQSTKFYMIANPDTDNERRCRMWKNQDSFGTRHREFYASAWIFFPNEQPWNGEGTLTWNNIFAVTIWFGPNDNKWKYYWAAKFRMLAGDREIKFEHKWHNYPTDGDKVFRTGTGYYTDNQLKGVWTQFQIYVKVTSGSDSVIRAWIDDMTNPVYEKTTWTEKGITKLAPEAYSAWSSLAGYWGGQTHDGYPALSMGIYSNTGTQPSKTIYIDDIVWATEKVPDTYRVDEPQIEWEKFEDGFEDGVVDDDWDGKEESDGSVTIESTNVYQGSYAADFTTVNGEDDNYARLYAGFQGRDDVFIRSFVRLEDLPDTDDTSIEFLMVSQSGGPPNWHVYVGVRREAGPTYYWVLGVKGETLVKTSDTISADTWYAVELYMNATTNGNATMYVNDVQKCQDTGDFSGLGSIARAYIYIDTTGVQTSGKTVYHDVVVVDDKRIYGGPTEIFQATFFTFEVATENETGTYYNPLADVTINGTRLTNVAGYYTWQNLVFGLNEFHIEPPSGYYPGWILNYNGYFSWNGSAFILFHTITEEEVGYLEIYFHDTLLPYVKQVPSATALVAVDMEKDTLWGDEFSFQVSGSSWIAIHSGGYAEDPFLCAGSTATAKSYNASTGVCNITVASSTTLVLLYDRPTPTHWSFWFLGSGVSALAALLLGLWNRTKEILRKWKWPIITFIITLTGTGLALWLTELIA